MYALTTFFAGVFLLLSSCAGPMDQGDLGTDISNQEEAAESEVAELSRRLLSRRLLSRRLLSRKLLKEIRKPRKIAQSK